ncbi:coiled-coil domain-containing protein 57 [Echeneis naucrates]|uniref:coiled-coil domain-containing protein 57 n=1 Tax=Echeneis naucrates TaxID=173247 RepID=UPI001113DC5F|nr:coiled-coil domain-containing protein 57-like [Echeneis naucrates]
MLPDGDSRLGLETQLASKQREWKELQALRVHQLEGSLRKAQEESSSLREQYQQLREDFQFNLVILEERDRELERYDVITARALTLEQDRQKELRQLRTQVTKLEEMRAREAEEREEECRMSRESATQQRLQLEQVKSSIAEGCERVKWDLLHRIDEAEVQMALERHEMTAAFKREVRQREHEFNMKMDEMCAVVLSHELKVKMLSKETEIHCQVQLQATEALKAQEEFCQQIQAQLQQKDQEIKRLNSLKKTELDREVKRMETKLKKKDDNIKKCESAVQAAELQQRIEFLTAQLCHIQKEQQDAIEQKDQTIQRLHKELETVKTSWDKYMMEVSRKSVVKDTEIIALQEKETKLKTELERSRQEMETYKQQLSAGLKREHALGQVRVQVELEWQRCCEDMKAELCLANEQLIQGLTQARDQAEAELKEKEQELQDLTVLLRSVKTERDHAIQGLTPKVDFLASEQIRHLQEQNNILRAVVTQMRKEMEGLSHQPPPPQGPQQLSPSHIIQHLGSNHPSFNLHTADAQKAIGPPPQSTDISSKVSPAEKTTKPQQDKSVQTESPLTNITEKSALPQQLREENLHLKQPQMSSQFQHVQGQRNHPPNMHTRLKKAASCIAHLSRDKQQLIEMCNSLRAQITNAGLKEPELPEKEIQGDQQDRLSALEKLQYQLTTQELRYVLRQRLRVDSDHLFSETHHQGATRRSANPWSQSSKTTERSESSKNKENTHPVSRSQSLVDMGLQPHSSRSRSLLSSAESLQSLKELWDKLDHALSPSVFSGGTPELSRRVEGESGDAGLPIMVRGISAPIHSESQKERMNPHKTQLQMTKTSRPGAHCKISKIRNYNIKD